ncbi:uncharacterized protein BKCO1_2000071 [Diplodia corticola]|uniref:Uncharacterized protein n=1 Tax=Diplodia corticola TaxID=236234 RepID=A0A1J9S2K5_9PEZI|nr:uncharacterized protein BKCO1_2000071 [Diplodia corticola]OJD34799.1 hypothetical protein BKCO1_2000071 [Diplodia corticola]
MTTAAGSWGETRRKETRMAPGAEDDIAVSTARGDIRGARYPHVLNHISIYTIPSIDEVLDLYHDFQSSSDHDLDLEPSHPDGCRSDPSLPRRAQHKGDNDSILASIARAYAGTNGPEVIGPGSQLYNTRNAYPSSSGDSESLTICRKDSWESAPSVTDSDDSVYLSTIFEEPEPPELGVDVDIVKPTFRTRRRRDILMARDCKIKGDRAGLSDKRI